MDTEGLEQQELQTTESTEQGAAPEADASTESSQEQAQAAAIAELEALEKFKFNGREMTAKELNSMVMAHADYTKKTQAISEERKFRAALQHDLPLLQKDHLLADKFKKAYPPEYHYLLDVLGINAKREQTQAPGKEVSPETQELIQRIERIEGQTRDKQVQAIGVELDNIFESMAKKYPYAREKEVLSAASSLLDQMIQEQGNDAQLSAAHFDKLFKQSNDEIQSLAKKLQSEQVKQQKQANARGRDVGPGGGLPGREPVRPRTIKEATAAAMQEIQGLS